MGLLPYLLDGPDDAGPSLQVPNMQGEGLIPRLMRRVVDNCDNPLAEWSLQGEVGTTLCSMC
eukprot:jgi/Botrbrau1/12071/Bobra.0295s0026.1